MASRQDKGKKTKTNKEGLKGVLNSQRLLLNRLGQVLENLLDLHQHQLQGNLIRRGSDIHSNVIRTILKEHHLTFGQKLRTS